MRTRTLVAVGAAAAIATIALIVPGPGPASAGDPPPAPELSLQGRYSTGLPDTSAEIVAFEDGLMYVLNATDASVDVVDVSDPATPVLDERLQLDEYGPGAQSVAVEGGTAVVAVQAEDKTDPGSVVFFQADGSINAEVPTGALPDMVTFTPDGSKVLTADEGEPASDYSVDPEGSVSIVLAGPYRQVCEADTFADVPEAQPFAEEIGWLVERCVTSGFEDGTFKPGSAITRQSAAAFLYRMSGSPQGEDPTCEEAAFPDVSSSHPFCGEIAWMVEQGITTGYEDDTFKPSSPVTRQSMAAFLYRLDGSVDGDDPTCEEAQLDDVGTGHPFCGEIAWMVGRGITTGFEDGTYRGGTAVSRQAAAAFFQRIAQPQTVSFTDFNVGGPREDEVTDDIRIFGPDASVAQDLEPEYIASSSDSSEVWVTLQENNALARIDVGHATVTELQPLGTVDRSLEDNGYGSSNGFDGSDRDGPGSDGAIDIATWPVQGLFLPDGIASYESGGETFLVTANEGDAREYVDAEDEPVLVEEARLSSVDLDPTAFPTEVAEEIQDADGIGRLNITTTMGDTDGDEDYDELYTLGGRSFSIWDADGTQVWDSGDQLEQLTAEALPDFFNSDNADDSFDDRSDNKGPEPEAVAVGTVDGRAYAFVGLERVGGVMVFDVTDPEDATFVQYFGTRVFDEEDPVGPDSAPEGMRFLSADESPTGAPALLVSHEVSGTVTLLAFEPAV
jgi:DNA-binding beta-propeller fold protein YncE